MVGKAVPKSEKQGLCICYKIGDDSNSNNMCNPSLQLNLYGSLHDILLLYAVTSVLLHI